ncbi:Leucine-rich repeats and immunoglobulin-like domains protein 3 [Eumeta japonica]|uniref:Leucine-rich repeats and immunoglobulin-like domains protein 3 n=1 Tax=Eumeta variegata TaxID=151549 RepID=A0A4C1T0W6_EUMVA|nr:Leucine-rich repeats and immunoglobulin-like domains protein 3 [Eumeta japonica]
MAASASPATVIAAVNKGNKKSLFSTASRTKNLKDKQRSNRHRRPPPHRHLNTNYNDDDDDDEGDDDGDDFISFPMPPHHTLLETTGFVADDGQQYEKAEKALAAAGILSNSGSASSTQQQPSSPLTPNNNLRVLKRNQLETVPKFVGLSSLKQLSLAHNRIQKISAEALAVLPKLKVLDLSKNYLHTVEASYFPATNRLAHLILNNNEIASISETALENMSDLLDLDLNNNRLSILPAGVFANLAKLRKLRWLTRHYQNTANQKQLQPSSQQHSNTLQAVCGETPKPMLVQEPSNQLAVKGANITMECRATSPTAASLAAADELKIKWRHDNHNIKERDRNSMLMSSTNSAYLMPYTTTETQIHHETSSNQTTIIGYLRLFNLSYESAGKYQCVVSNAFGTTYSQNLKCLLAVRLTLNQTFSIDFPAANERRLQVLREENAFVIINAKPIDSGIYTCTAESPAGEIKVNASLIVNDKPQPTIPVVRKEIVVGKSSVLECLSDVAAELNQPHREWYKDNKPFHITPTLDTDRYYFTAENELLIIVNSQSVDSGHYRCEITDNSKTYTMQMELTYLRAPRDSYNNHTANQRPRSLAALEMNGSRYNQGVEDEHQPLTEQRNFLIVTTTPNYQQLLMQRQAHEEDRTDDEHLTLEYLRLNRSHDGDHHQDHLSSKDSGTGSDAAVKRSLEDFSITLMANASTPTSTAGGLASLLETWCRASLAKQDTDEDEEYNHVPVNSITALKPNGSTGSTEDTEDFAASPTLGVSVYHMEDGDLQGLSCNNNHHSPPPPLGYKTSDIDGTNGTGNSLQDNNKDRAANNHKSSGNDASSPQHCKASTNFSKTPTSSSLPSPPPIPLRTQTVDI